MGKTLALFSAIFLMLIALYSSIFIDINKEKDNVVVTESIVYGDKSFAEDITIIADARYRNKLQWKTQYTIAETPEAKTEFKFHPFGIKDEDSEFIKNLSVYTCFNFSTSGGDFNNNIFNTMKNAYDDMMKNAEPYKHKEKTILLSDYFDYYPLAVDLSFENLHISFPFFDSNISEYEQSIINEFNDYFRIPIVEGHKLSISAIVNESGNISQWGTSYTEETSDSFDFYMEGCITDSNVFLSFDNKTLNGKIIDTTNIPCGYGIYCIPYTETENSVIFDFENIKNVYPVDEKNGIYEIHFSENKENLYIMTRENNKSFMTVIDTVTFEKKFRLEISSFEKGYSYVNRIGENFILYSTYDELADKNYYTVVSINENEEYKNEFTVLTEYMGDIAKWNGEYLYLANTEYDVYNIHPCGFDFTVYNKDGLKFRGEYALSLATGYDGYMSSSYYVYIGHDAIDFVLPSE